MTVLRLYAPDGNYARLMASELSQQKKNWFIGWKCLAGNRSLFIDQDGEVYSAHCKSTGIYGKQGSLGNVFEKFRLESAPINCARRFCESEFDLAIPKYHRPKFQDVIDREAAEVSEVQPAVALRGEGEDLRKIHWNVSGIEKRSFSQWKNAVHGLEKFFKGEVGEILLVDPPEGTQILFDLIKFLVDEKGHKVTIEGSLGEDPTFFQRCLEAADLDIRLERDEELFFQNLDEIGETQKELHRRHVFRKVRVLIDLDHPEYLRLRESLFGENYREWLEPGFFLKKFVSSVPRPVVEVPTQEKVRKSRSGSKVLLFIPMRNCEGTIEKVLENLRPELLDFVDEILILDNDSSDRSMALARSALRKIQGPKVILRKNEKNYGFGGSHKLAIQYAYQTGMDYLLIVHGDNSGSPDDFFPILENGDFLRYDIVLSTRLGFKSSRTNYPLYRYLGNLALNFLASLATFSMVSDFTGGPVSLYRVQTFMNRFENPVKDFSNRISFPQDAFLYVKFKRGLVRFVPIRYHEAGGKTFFSASTQFVRAVIQLISYLFGKRKSFS